MDCPVKDVNQAAAAALMALLAADCLPASLDVQPRIMAAALVKQPRMSWWLQLWGTRLLHSCMETMYRMDAKHDAPWQFRNGLLGDVSAETSSDVPSQLHGWSCQLRPVCTSQPDKAACTVSHVSV